MRLNIYSPTRSETPRRRDLMPSREQSRKNGGHRSALPISGTVGDIISRGFSGLLSEHPPRHFAYQKARREIPKGCSRRHALSDGNFRWRQAPTRFLLLQLSDARCVVSHVIRKHVQKSANPLSMPTLSTRNPKRSMEPKYFPILSRQYGRRSYIDQISRESIIIRMIIVDNFIDILKWMEI